MRFNKKKKQQRLFFSITEAEVKECRRNRRRRKRKRDWVSVCSSMAHQATPGDIGITLVLFKNSKFAVICLLHVHGLWA